jgi:hypothetical protein
VPELAHNRSPVRRAARSAFTLVELVTAAALMTIMMLGIIQIFAQVTQAAGDAEGFQFAQQQERALFDTIHRDVRGMTREGYFRIKTDTPSPYGTDLMAWTTVCPVTGSWSGASAEAYEVVYTTHVKTPTAELTLGGGTVDKRCGLLGRAVWLFTGQGNGGTDTVDNAKTATLSEMEANPALYMRSQDFLTVYPLTSADGYPVSANAPSLRTVLASRCSEFYVEYMVFNTNAANGPTNDYIWIHGDQYIAASNQTAVGSRNPVRAIRVTVAIHDPDDRAPVPSANGRYRGYALQEVFWLGDP